MPPGLHDLAITTPAAGAATVSVAVREGEVAEVSAVLAATSP